MSPDLFRKYLLAWYDGHKRDLPWRRSADPYRVWISEVMLQQTRVMAVLPYYERFLARFPTIADLAAAPEQDLLAAWAGLGYYSRARNLQKAALRIVSRGEFPRDYESIRSLPGIGDYTAAAVGSIAFQLPLPALDGNVLRVLSRFTAEPGDIAAPAVRTALRELAGALLDPRRPGDFNQAMMELGATICLPAKPQCLLCPLRERCEARRLGAQREFPVKRGKPAQTVVEQRLLLIEREDALLLWQRPPESRRMAGFWELPLAGQFPKARLVAAAGEFRHTIVNTNYRIQVYRASIRKEKPGFTWLPKEKLNELPLSTTAKKALGCLVV